MKKISGKLRAAAAGALAALLLISGCGGGAGSSQSVPQTESAGSSLAVETESETKAETKAETETDRETETEKRETGQTDQGKAEVRGYVAIDPGHQGSWVDMSAKEPSAPGSSVMKAKATAGTTGRYSGTPEYELNLAIGLKLRDQLQARGYKVIMTREDNDTAISNSERAKLANESGADCVIRLHADGADNSGVHGASVLVPSSDNKYVGSLHEESQDLGKDIIDSYCKATGIKNNGISLRDDLSGTNWSKIPVALLELGFMSNKSDDLKMDDDSFRKKMVKGIADGIDRYFEDHPTSYEGAAEQSGGDSSVKVSTESARKAKSAATAKTGKVIEDIKEKYTDASERSGEKWSVTLVDLYDSSSADTGGSRKMLSASVLKTFIMAAAYDRALYSDSVSMSEGEKDALRGKIEKMITVSDNDAANSVVEDLGGGSFSKGMDLVNDFCRENGYDSTHMGRKFLAGNSNGDNYTSSNDCAYLLTDIYDGTCVSKEASNEMLDFLKAQQRTGKIPAGLSGTGAKTANKTGELSGDTGHVENDIAIVWGENADYALCVLSSGVKSNEKAASQISAISKTVYQEMDK